MRRLRRSYGGLKFRMLSRQSMHTFTEVLMTRLNWVIGKDCAGPLQHALAFAGQLYHRCVINKEPAKRVAADLGFERTTCEGVVRILRSYGGVPSIARLAVICQLDPGYDDTDIAEVFGRTAEWSAEVRRDAEWLRANEWIPAQLEWLDDGLRPTDPAPEELYKRAKEARIVRGRNFSEPRSGIRSYAWRPRAASFVQIGVD